MTLMQAYHRYIDQAITDSLIQSFLDDAPSGIVAELVSQVPFLAQFDARQRVIWKRVAEFRLADRADALDDAQRDYGLFVAGITSVYSHDNALTAKEWLALLITGYLILLASSARIAGKRDATRDMARGANSDIHYFKRFERDAAGQFDPLTGEMEYLTEKQMIERAKLYAGIPRAVFWMYAEESEGGYGWVSQYIDKDDDRTCEKCEKARGFYLPGTGPMPGVVCLARGKCRCRRVMVYNLAEWERLRGSVSSEHAYVPGVDVSYGVY